MIRKSIFVAQNDSVSDTLLDAVKALFPGEKKQLRILDMGTGNGYIALSLCLDGYTNVEAADANLFAVRLTKKNALHNGVSLPVFRSDLFQSLQGAYDVIVFNFSPCDAPLTYFLYPIKNLFFADKASSPKAANKKRGSAFRLINTVFKSMYGSRGRRKMIERFLEQLPLYTNRNSIVLLHIHADEVKAFSRNAKIEILEETRGREGVILAMSHIEKSGDA